MQSSRHAADDLRDVVRVERAVRRIHALGRERQEEVLAHLEAALFEHRQHEFVGGARIGGGLQDDQLTGPQPLRDLLRRRDDVGHVRVLRLAERRRDADVDGVQLAEHVEVGGRAEPLRRHQAPRRARWARRRCRTDPRLWHSPFVRRGRRRCRSSPARPNSTTSGKTDVAEADHARLGAARANQLQQGGGGGRSNHS